MTGAGRRGRPKVEVRGMVGPKVEVGGRVGLVLAVAEVFFVAFFGAAVFLGSAFLAGCFFLGGMFSLFLVDLLERPGIGWIERSAGQEVFVVVKKKKGRKELRRCFCYVPEKNGKAWGRNSLSILFVLWMFLTYLPRRSLALCREAKLGPSSSSKSLFEERSSITMVSSSSAAAWGGRISSR
jgi:hypothetical protein